MKRQQKQEAKPDKAIRRNRQSQASVSFVAHAEPMEREQRWFPKVGRMGDSVDFQSLVVELQTDQMARLFGAVSRESTSGLRHAAPLENYQRTGRGISPFSGRQIAGFRGRGAGISVQ